MKRYVVLATAAPGLPMSSIDGSVVAVAFPRPARELETNLLRAAWTVSTYFIARTMFMPIMGDLGDTLGVSFIAFVLYLSRTPAVGFNVTFFTCGLGLLCAILPVFPVPSGEKA